MRWIARVGLLLLVVIATGLAAGYGLLSTSAGQDLLRRQTVHLVASVLGPNFSVAVGTQETSLAPHSGLGLEFHDIRISSADGTAELVTADALEVGLDFLKLMRGDVSIGRIRIDGVRVEPHIFDLAGSSRFESANQLFPILDRIAQAVLRSDVRLLMIRDAELAGTAEAGKISSLSVEVKGANHFDLDLYGMLRGRSLSVSGNAVAADNGRLSSLDMSMLTLDVAAGVPANMGELADVLPDGRLALQTRLSLSERSTRRQLDITSALKDVAAVPTRDRFHVALRLEEGADKIQILDGHLDFDRFEAAFRGNVASEVQPNGMVPFSLISNRLLSRGAAEHRDQGAAAQLSLEGALGVGSGQLMSVSDAELSDDLGSIRLNASLDGLRDEDRLNVHMKMDRLQTRTIKAYWPWFLAKKPRDFLLSHVADPGEVTSGILDFNARLDRIRETTSDGVVFDPAELSGALQVAGLTVATAQELPSVTALGGRIDLVGENASIELSSGRIDGFTDVELEPSTIGLTNEGAKHLATMSINVAGNAGSLLRLGLRKPIDAARFLDWKPEDISGKARVGASLVLRLRDDEDEVDAWSLVADLDRVDLKRLLAGRKISDVTGLVTLADSVAIGDVGASIDGLPTKLSFSHSLDPQSKNSFNVKLQTSVNATTLEKALPELADVLDGKLSASLTQSQDGLSANVDLTDARIRLPYISWTKGAGIAATLSFDAAKEGDGYSLERIHLKGESFNAEGRVESQPGQFHAVLDRVALNRGDQFSLDLQKKASRVDVAIKGPSLDMRPLLASIRSDGGDAIGPSTDSGSAEATSVQATIERLTGFDGEFLQGSVVTFTDMANAAPTLSLAAVTGAGHKVELEVGSKKEGRVVDLKTDDAGALLRFAGLYPKMRGGSADLAMRGEGTGLVGALELRDFTLVDESRMERLVGSAPSGGQSLSGAMGGSPPTADVHFDFASSDLRWLNGALTAENGIVRGPVFGSSFQGMLYNAAKEIDISGSFMPAYRYNHLFGALPLVGTLLGNGHEGGLIGITYRLAGAFSDPTLSINPISMIAPGIIRRIFEY